MCCTSPELRSASSYGRFTAAKEFWSQCHIFRFGNDRRSSRRGLLGRQNCILSWKSVPQGPFGQIKLYFKLEKRPAGAFWADKSNPRPMPQSPGRLQGGGTPRGTPGESGCSTTWIPRWGEKGGNSEGHSHSLFNPVGSADNCLQLVVYNR